MGTDPPWGGRIHIYTCTARFLYSSSSEGHYHVSRAINENLMSACSLQTQVNKWDSVIVHLLLHIWCLNVTILLGRFTYFIKCVSLMMVKKNEVYLFQITK